MKIKNCPNEAWNYEFIVAYNFSDGLVYYAHTTNGFEAEKMAHEIENGIIIHNVRIQGKVQEPKEEPKEKTYIFTGIWSYCCDATSKEEAIEKFANAEDWEFEMDFENHEITELKD